MDNISAVREKVNITDLITSYVPLRKSGKNYKANCPFHKEKTPSFMVSEELQRYRCFGCGKSGDVFNFVMEFEGVEFGDALKMLAEKAGIKLKQEDNKYAKESKEINQKILKMNAIAAKFYFHLLTKHKFGEPALKYLKDRGINESTINEFKLGYAPNSWDSLSKLLVKKGYSPKDIVDSGLGRYRKGNSDTYDMFRARLMFPLTDHMGKIIGFAGRALDNQEPKYINTQETVIFHKERFLFGLDKAKASIRQKNKAIIVEGEFDMISPYQAGYKNIAASKGTALTLGQVALLKRYAQTAILVFDNDEAGVEAAMRGTHIIQNAGVDLKVASIPKGYKDPDDLVKDNPSKFEKVISSALPLWDYYFLYAKNKWDLSDVFEKKNASNFLVSAIRNIEDEVIKSSYIKKFASLFDMKEETVISMLEKKDLKKTHFKKIGDESDEVSVNINGGLEKYPSTEVYLLSLLAKMDSDVLRKRLGEIDEGYFENIETKYILDELKKTSKVSKKFDVKVFYDKLSDDKESSRNFFEQIYLLDLPERLLEDEAFDEEVKSAVTRLKKGFLSRKLKEITKAIQKAELVSDSLEVKKLQKEAQKYSRFLAETK